MTLLLVTSSSRGQECLAALEKAVGKVEGAGSIRAALSRLRQKEFAAVAVDQNMLDSDPAALETLAHHWGTAAPIYINLALHAVERVVREVQMALQRRDVERTLARQAETAVLRNELRNAVTGILLSSQLALQTSPLPAAAQTKLRTVCELAESMRSQLGI